MTDISKMWSFKPDSPKIRYLVLSYVAKLEIWQTIHWFPLTSNVFDAWHFKFLCLTEFPEPGQVLHLQIVAFLLQVSGVEGIMSAYAMALHNVALAGPTLFGPVINKAAEIASRSLSTRQNKYFILLIITVSLAVLACHLTAQFF